MIQITASTRGDMKICPSFFLLHIDTHLQTCQLYYKPIVHEHKYLSFLFFRFYSLTWERGYIIGYREKQSQKFTYLISMDSCGEYFLFYWPTDFVIFSTGLKIWLLVQATFCLPLPGALALGSLAATSVQQLFLPPYFCWWKELPLLP